MILLFQSFMSFNLYNDSIILFILFELQQSRNRRRSDTIRNIVKQVSHIPNTCNCGHR